ncbi:hypothetical protein FB45DRAFT_923700 [Roridomyces roridus]|uniref:Uncharacterized protein n=1 Tax=Roridomyces roridus TaxID=1738132 RepID=A0AAD7FKN0_9AGAR|nr:hypothetical protein FB45DRAFT_923700 [Roridomyces roridus]
MSVAVAVASFPPPPGGWHNKSGNVTRWSSRPRLPFAPNTMPGESLLRRLEPTTTPAPAPGTGSLGFLRVVETVPGLESRTLHLHTGHKPFGPSARTVRAPPSRGPMPVRPLPPPPPPPKDEEKNKVAVVASTAPTFTCTPPTSTPRPTPGLLRKLPSMGRLLCVEGGYTRLPDVPEDGDEKENENEPEKTKGHRKNRLLHSRSFDTLVARFGKPPPLTLPRGGAKRKPARTRSSSVVLARSTQFFFDSYDLDDPEALDEEVREALRVNASIQAKGYRYEDVGHEGGRYRATRRATV